MPSDSVMPVPPVAVMIVTPRSRLGREHRQARVLAIQAVPAASNRPVGQLHHPTQIVQDQLIDLGLVKRLDRLVVLVGIADDDLPQMILGCHDVDAVTDELRQLLLDALPQPGQRRTDAECRIVAQRQPAGQVWAESPAGRLRHRAHHLQLAAADARAGKYFGKQRLEVDTAGHDHLFRLPGATVRGVDVRWVHGRHRRAEMHFHRVGPAQVLGNGRDRLAWIDAQLGRTPEGPEQSVGTHGRRPAERFREGQQLAVKTQAGGLADELLQHCQLVVPVSQVQGTTSVDPEARLPGQFQPQLPAAQGPLVHLAGSLADGPDHAEVADGRPPRPGVAVKQADRKPTPGGRQGMGQTHDAAADHRHVPLSPHLFSLPGPRSFLCDSVGNHCQGRQRSSLAWSFFRRSCAHPLQIASRPEKITPACPD